MGCDPPPFLNKGVTPFFVLLENLRRRSLNKVCSCLPSSRCIGSAGRADPARGGASGDVQEAAGGGEGLQQVSHSDQERRGPQAAGRRRPGEQAGGGQEGGRRGEEEV